VKFITYLLYAISDPTTHQDDEYVWAGVDDPKLVVTTSHNPSSRLKQFAKVSLINSWSTYFPLTGVTPDVP